MVGTGYSSEAAVLWKKAALRFSSPEEEREYVERYLLNPTAENRKILNDRLVRSRIEYAISVAWSYRNIPGSTFSEKISDAVLGLIRAAEAYRPEVRGASFTGFAAKYMAGQVLRRYSKSSWKHVESREVSMNQPLGRENRDGERMTVESTLPSTAVHAYARKFESSTWSTRFELDEYRVYMWKRLKKEKLSEGARAFLLDALTSEDIDSPDDTVREELREMFHMEQPRPDLVWEPRFVSARFDTPLRSAGRKKLVLTPKRRTEIRIYGTGTFHSGLFIPPQGNPFLGSRTVTTWKSEQDDAYEYVVSLAGKRLCKPLTLHRILQIKKQNMQWSD